MSYDDRRGRGGPYYAPPGPSGGGPVGPPGSAGRRDWPGAFPGPQGPPGSVGRGPPPSESAAAGTSPDDSQGSAARLAYPPGTYWRFPSRNEEFHPRQYWHRYQLESATRKLTNEWSEWKQTRDIFQSRQRIVAKKMRLPYRTIYQSELLYTRYVNQFEDMNRRTPEDVAQTAFLLASKMSETMKKARELLQELDRVDREWGVPKPPETQAEFAERLDKTKKRIMECEQEMLEIIGFDFHTSQPQEWIVKFAKCLAELGRLSPEDAKRLAKRAWLIIPEMSRCTDLMLRFTPERLAMAALLLASRTGIIGADPPMTNDPAMPKDDPIEPRRDTKHQHWLDSLPNLPFSTVFDRNVDFRRKHGRALVFEAAIDAADSIAEYYSKHRGLDVVAVLIREIANTLRVSEFADSRHHPFKKPFWPGWEDERRRAESISGKPASELYIPPSAVESQRY